jgi:outer membrane protein TolC
MSELSVEALVEQVLARNPALPQMIAAWQAASARYPQATSLDDPMFSPTLGPATYGSSNVDPAYRLEISQKYPFPGKLRLRGENALAEASAAGNEVEDVRLQLIEAARNAFYDYYLVDRALAVNEESLRLLREFRENALRRYRAGLAVEQDIFQADVEIGRTRDRTFLLLRNREVAIARLNTLMHLPPDLPLPPPPRPVSWESVIAILPLLPPPVSGLFAGSLGIAARFLPGPLPAVGELRSLALERRPDLQALANRINAEEASLALAYREYYPDFEPFFMYDRFMGNTPEMRDLAYMLGVKVNLPVRSERRRGAVAEAQARIAQRRAELARQTDQVNFEVQQAHAQVRESQRVVRLYEEEVLPAARNNVRAAQAYYVGGRIPFLTLLEAQRNVVNLQDRYYEAIADYFRRLAALERVAGGTFSPWPKKGLP